MVHATSSPFVAMLSVRPGTYVPDPTAGVMFVAICTSTAQFVSAFWYENVKSDMPSSRYGDRRPIG